MRPTLRVFALCLLLTTLASAGPPAGARTPSGPSQLPSDRGWFWYEDPPPPSVRKPPPEIKKPVPAPGEKPLTVKWLRDNLDHFRDAALDDPTPRNVRLYMYLQKLAMDKAHAFARAVKLAVYEDPALDEAAKVGANNQARTARTVAQREATTHVLEGLAAEAGIWFFYRSDCPYCHAQIPVLQALEHLYGFKVMAIALDGMPLPGGEYPNWVADTGQGAKLHVEATPTLFLVAPPNKILPLSTGVVAVDQIEDRMIEMGHQYGWVSDQQFAQVRAEPRSSAVEFLQDGLPADRANLPDDPDLLLALLSAAANAGGKTPLSSPRNSTEELQP